MVENTNIDKKENESDYFKAERKRDLKFYTERINDLLTYHTKDKALAEIDKFIKDDKTDGITEYAPFYEIVKKYLNEEIDETKYHELVKEYIDDEVLKIDIIADAIVKCGIKNIEKIEVIEELKTKYTDMSIEEIKNAVDNFFDEHNNEPEENEATLEEGENIPPYDLSRAEIDGNIKKIYSYKVEGKITSGISELDQFLEIIQPALNQLIIIPWKFVYTAFDAKKMAFEKVKNYWQKQNDIVNMNEALKLMDFDDEDGNTIKAIPDGDEFVKSWDLKKNQNQIAGYFNHYMCKKLTKKLKDYKEARINQIKNDKHVGKTKAEQIFKEEEIEDFKNKGFSPSAAEEEYKKKYEPREKFFDFSKEADIAQNVLVEEFQNLIRKVRGPDGKVSDENMKKLRGFIAMVNLFNLNDKDIIPNNYGYTLSYMLGEIQSRSEPGKPRIEDDTTIMADAKSKQENNDIATQFRNYVQSMQTSSNG